MNPTNAYLKQTRTYRMIGDERYPNLTPKLHCADGFTVSVQASRTHYCEPRRDDGPWYTVELGFPSSADDLIQQYADTPDDPTGTVYGYVPVAVVDALIEKHGGIKR